MRFWYKRSFEKACRKYPPDIQRLAAHTVFQVKSWYLTRYASVGLGIKKLHDGPSGKVFEARVNLDLRLVWVEQGGSVWFAVIGSHEVVRRYIRTVR